MLAKQQFLTVSQIPKGKQMLLPSVQQNQIWELFRFPIQDCMSLKNIRLLTELFIQLLRLLIFPDLAKGSNKGEGVGNKFLGDIRNTDALIHVLRCFDNEALPHIDGSVDPVRDLETIDLELQVKDLESVEKKIERLERAAKTGDKDAKHGSGGT